jgi:hypothetical protein
VSRAQAARRGVRECELEHLIAHAPTGLHGDHAAAFVPSRPVCARIATEY